MNRAGYGRFKLNGRMQKAHRVSWKLYKGPILQGEGYHGTCVCHRCDNPGCVNPEHLELGTHADNMDDMVDKGRQAKPKGEDNTKAKLTESQVREIRRLAEDGSLLQKEIGKMFGVSNGTVSDIKTRKIWRHLK